MSLETGQPASLFLSSKKLQQKNRFGLRRLRVKGGAEPLLALFPQAKPRAERAVTFPLQLAFLLSKKQESDLGAGRGDDDRAKQSSHTDTAVTQLTHRSGDIPHARARAGCHFGCSRAVTESAQALLLAAVKEWRTHLHECTVQAHVRYTWYVGYTY